MSKPLMIELFAGLHGWGEAAVQEGWRVVGFDIVDMCAELGFRRPEGCQLVLQDVLTLHGSQFKDAAVIVASPPCQAYSYRAMPWKRAKALPPPSNELFDACFRIQREAIEATGQDCPACYGLGPRHRGHVCPKCNGTSWISKHIPLIVENVCGAQKWVGPARWHYGSFYLWGDVPALMPTTAAIKNKGGSWFAIANNTTSGHSHNPCRKVPGINWNGYGTPGYKPQGFNVSAAQRYREGIKDKDQDGYERNHPQAFGWKSTRTSSRSDSRKAASAQIAKIPEGLARHIAQVFHPRSADTSGQHNTENAEATA